MVLVVTLLVILASLTYPTLEGMYGSYRIQAAADQIRGHWAAASSAAINDSRPYRFAIVPGKGNYRIAPDSGDFWNGNGSGSGVVIEDALPRGIAFRLGDSPLDSSDRDTVMPSGSVDPTSYQPLVTFLPDGSTREDLQIILDSPGAAGALVIRLRALTGSVTVRPLSNR